MVSSEAISIDVEREKKEALSADLPTVRFG